jgi:hypothetical protein
MNFQYKVKKTNEVDSRIYDLTIYIGAKFTKTELVDEVEVSTEMVKVATDLVLTLSNGYLKKYSEYDFPATVLNAINGFDTDTMLPTVSAVALNEILQSFELELAN